MKTNLGPVAALLASIECLTVTLCCLDLITVMRMPGGEYDLALLDSFQAGVKTISITVEGSTKTLETYGQGDVM